MDRLKSYEVFVAVAERGGFARAARMLNMSNAMVSEHVANLERRVGERLLVRNSRKVQLTGEGARLLPEARRLIDAVRVLESPQGRSGRNPAGRVRVDMPMAVGAMYVLPHLRRFREEYPEITLDLTLGDRGTLMRLDDFDLVVRVSSMELRRVVVHTLTHTRFIQAASPAYLQARGVPTEPEDLQSHDCILYGASAAANGEYWRFARDGETRWVRPHNVLMLNDGGAIRQAGIDGIGVSQNLELLIGAELASGALQPVLTDWNRDLLPVKVFADHERAQSAAVAATLSFLIERIPWPKPS